MCRAKIKFSAENSKQTFMESSQQPEKRNIFPGISWNDLKFESEKGKFLGDNQMQVDTFF